MSGLVKKNPFYETINLTFLCCPLLKKKRGKERDMRSGSIRYIINIKDRDMGDKRVSIMRLACIIIPNDEYE